MPEKSFFFFFFFKKTLIVLSEPELVVVLKFLVFCLISSPKPKNAQFTITYDQKKSCKPSHLKRLNQQMWLFFLLLKNDWNYYLIIQIVTFTDLVLVN